MGRQILGHADFCGFITFLQTHLSTNKPMQPVNSDAK